MEMKNMEEWIKDQILLIGTQISEIENLQIPIGTRKRMIEIKEEERRKYFKLWEETNETDS